MTQALSVRDIQGATLDARSDRLPNDLFSAGLFVSGDEFKVQQQASPNMTIRVGSGVAGDRYVVPGTHAQGTFLVLNRNDPYVGSANSDLPIANGNGANPRIDGIDLRVYDDEADSSGFTKAEVVVTQGTPGSSPSAPAVPSGAARLATILVDATESTSIVTGDITDTRTLSYPVGGIARRTSATRPASPWEGLLVYETDTDRLVVYNGSAWEILSQAGGWTSYTPTVTGSGAFAVGNATIAGRTYRTGRKVTDWVRFAIGSTTNIGTGNFVFGLSTTPTATGRWVGPAWGQDSSDSGQLIGVARNTGFGAATFYMILSKTGTPGALGATFPMVPAINDEFEAEITYEAAS